MGKINVSMDKKVYSILERHFTSNEKITPDEYEFLGRYFAKMKKYRIESASKEFYFEDIRSGFVSQSFKGVTKCRRDAASYCESNPGVRVLIHKKIGDDDILLLEYVGLDNGVVRRKRLYKGFEEEEGV